MKIRKILVVDDDKPVSSYLQRKFGKLGYEVSVADDGEEALKQAFANAPDSILLDVKLPGMSGIEVCKTLRLDARTRHIPVVVFSAKAQTPDIKQALDAGADKYLCKPMSFLQILKELQSFEKNDRDTLSDVVVTIDDAL